MILASQVTQSCEFECCYLIDKSLNAHRYRLEVTVEGPQREEDYGYVMEFSKLHNYIKSVVPDGMFIFDTSSSNVGRDVAFILGQRGIPVKGLPFALCAESICNYISTSLQSILDHKEPGVNIVVSKLRENSTSYVSWRPAVSYTVS